MANDYGTGKKLSLSASRAPKKRPIDGCIALELEFDGLGLLDVGAYTLPYLTLNPKP